MSSPILPARGPLGPSSPIPAANGAIATIVAELTRSEPVLTIEASRGAPPPEVLEQIAVAATIEERLRESGRQLYFTSAAPGVRTRIELHDHDGNVERTLSTAQALELATGRPLG